MISEMRMSGKRFFDAKDRLAFWLAGGVAFATYALSLGPSVGLEDAGELATAADGLGVPHPPGYPLWTLGAWVFCRLFGWVTWQGWPSPAWAVALFSAVAGALAAGVTALLIVRSGRDLLAAATGRADDVGADAAAWVGGVAGALAFAFSPVMWSQAAIVEVYALGALFLALTLLLLYKWMRRPRTSTLVWLGLVFGLGLTNYQVLLLAALPIALLVFLRRWRLGLSFVALLVPLGLTAYLLTLGALPSADLYSTPGDPVILRPAAALAAFPVALAPGWFYVALGACLTAGVGLLAFRRTWRWAALPLAGAAGLLAWSGASVERALPEGFLGTLYDFRAAWAIHAAGLAALWAVCWRFRRSRRFAAAVTAVQVAGLTLMQQGLLLGLTDPNLWWFWWPVGWNAAVLALAWRLLLRGRCVALTALAAEVGVSVYAYMPIASEGNPAMNWGYARTWEGFKHAISRGQYEALAPSDFLSMRYLRQLGDYLSDLRLQFSAPVAALGTLGTAALAWRVGRRKGWRGLAWLGCTVLFFLVMSALLVALANPSGDIQDGFVQKVKFISSHGIFALWVGYGLAALLALLRRWRWAWRAGLLAALATAAAPVWENFTDDDLVRRMGAAEQTGHDFGWQFGAYMIGGAPTLRAELSPDEEPLPDPFWPPPMAQGAIFFGGTDPGRFVPTYLVHAVGMRPDLHVLTQNALADPTYMNGVRDLHGADIWVPTADDVTDAFADYVDAVRRGERETAGTVTEANGRLQLSGTQAVMDVNAELARDLFARNPNDCYVEESYPVPWMDAFLEPAGLAMRLRREGRNLWAVADRDADFWDWMTRRLAPRTAYRRDFAAQKSFSKLRSAIAGVYARNGLAAPAEKAYQDALALYPISPEVVFSTVREALIPARRFAEALRLVRAYRRADPKNARAAYLEGRLEALAEAHAEFDALTAKVRAQTATTADVCALAGVCEALGLDEQSAAYWGQVVHAPDLTAGGALEGCLALQRLGRGEEALALLRRVPEAAWPNLSPEEMVACGGLAQARGDDALAHRLFQAALKRAPGSGAVWLGVALYHYGRGEGARAYEAMRTAVRHGAAPLIEADPAVAKIFLYLAERYGPRKGVQQ